MSLNSFKNSEACQVSTFMKKKNVLKVLKYL